GGGAVAGQRRPDAELLQPALRGGGQRADAQVEIVDPLAQRRQPRLEWLRVEQRHVQAAVAQRASQCGAGQATADDGDIEIEYVHRRTPSAAPAWKPAVWSTKRFFSVGFRSSAISPSRRRWPSGAKPCSNSAPTRSEKRMVRHWS